MTKNSIKHIWFDFSDTIASINRDAHNQLRYKTYSRLVNRPIDQALIDEFEALAQEHPNNNTALFHSLGKPSNYWSEQVNTVDPKQIYRLADETIPETLAKIKEITPISIFSNIDISKVMPSLGIELGLFTHILSSGMFKKPKPALDGFTKMIELSGLPAHQILYVGDDPNKDILPAKKVGIKTGLIYSTSTEADYCFERFDDVLDFLKAR